VPQSSTLSGRESRPSCPQCLQEPQTSLLSDTNHSSSETSASNVSIVWLGTYDTSNSLPNWASELT
jgi:hypothetical protein